MRRILSWVVLVLISWLVAVLTSVVIGVSVHILDLIDTLGTFLKVVIYIFGGATLLSFILLPVHYGSYAAISVSEAIKSSKKGTRYIVWSVFMIIMSIISTAIVFAKGTIQINYIIMCIYYIELIVINNRVRDERL